MSESLLNQVPFEDVEKWLNCLTTRDVTQIISAKHKFLVTVWYDTESRYIVVKHKDDWYLGHTYEITTLRDILRYFGYEEHNLYMKLADNKALPRMYKIGDILKLSLGVVPNTELVMDD